MVQTINFPQSMHSRLNCLETSPGGAQLVLHPGNRVVLTRKGAVLSAWDAASKLPTLVREELLPGIAGSVHLSPTIGQLRVG